MMRKACVELRYRCVQHHSTDYRFGWLWMTFAAGGTPNNGGDLPAT
jgi:hypothetical protein